MPDRPVIAIDGPAASGKGTLARRLAAHFDFAYLDTGLLYRAVGLAVLRAGGDPADAAAGTRAATGLDLSRLADPALRDEATATAAALVSAIPAVRAALIDLQRQFAAAPPAGAPGAVLDGRDIGTVICPGARCKIFVEAAVEIRAGRRVKELREKGLPAIPARVLQDMKQRDAHDRGRAIAPLVPAADAFVLDTTTLDADGAFEAALAFVLSKGIAPPPRRA